VAKSQALDATRLRKWQPNATEPAKKQAFTPKLVLKNVAVARRLTGYAQMVTPDKVAPDVQSVGLTRHFAVSTWRSTVGYLIKISRLIPGGDLTAILLFIQ
jgi:hypothetical protein